MVLYVVYIDQIYMGMLLVRYLSFLVPLKLIRFLTRFFKIKARRELFPQANNIYSEDNIFLRNSEIEHTY